MVLSPRSIHLFKLSLIVIIIFIAAFYLFSDRDYHHAYRVAVSGKKAAFVEKAVDVEIDGPFDNSSMVDMCAGKHWRPGLIFHCQPPRGGIANIRNIILNCVRYAIEAGGMFSLPNLSLIPTHISYIHHCPRNQATPSSRKTNYEWPHRPREIPNHRPIL